MVRSEDGDGKGDVALAEQRGRVSSPSEDGVEVAARPLTALSSFHSSPKGNGKPLTYCKEDGVGEG